MHKEFVSTTTKKTFELCIRNTRWVSVIYTSCSNLLLMVDLSMLRQLRIILESAKKADTNLDMYFKVANIVLILQSTNMARIYNII